jgi:hypothetical protein
VCVAPDFENQTSMIVNFRLLDIHRLVIIIPLLSRWCWNWQTGMVEGHVPLGREGSTPSQRTQKAAFGGLFILKSAPLDLT